MEPLTALLSQTLVAFTIEFDNEAEHQMPHRTTAGGAGNRGDGLWLVSMPMWSNFLRYLPATGASKADLSGVLALTNLAGMVRWGYVTMDEAGTIIPTPQGRAAQRLWAPLAVEVEERWANRYGAAMIGGLRGSLTALVEAAESAAGVELPDHLPVARHGMRVVVPSVAGWRPTPVDVVAGAAPDLAALLSRVLVSIALAFEGPTKLALAHHADVLRVLGPEPLRLRDLVRASGVSREAMAMALRFLGPRDLVAVESDPSGERGRVVRLTDRGEVARARGRHRLADVEADWADRMGAATVAEARTALETLVGGGAVSLDRSPLAEAVEPYPDGWRAHVARPAVLPHFPMVLHRGGYPDGS